MPTEYAARVQWRTKSGGRLELSSKMFPSDILAAVSRSVANHALNKYGGYSNYRALERYATITFPGDHNFDDRRYFIASTLVQVLAILYSEYQNANKIIRVTRRELL